MDVNPLYQVIRDSKEKIIVLQGGTWSGKTVATLQNIATWCAEMPGLICTVVAEDVPNLKKGAIRDALKIIDLDDEIRPQVLDYNRSDRHIIFKNRSIIEFSSFETEEDAKHGKRNILFCNEAQSIKYEIYWQLALRTSLQPFSKIIIDYNPNAPFWAHEKLIGKPGVLLNISDHRHNLYLTEDQHNEIENIEDPDLWDVYARGQTGLLKASIYPNWKNIDINKFPKSYKETIWGIDYGYGSKESSGKTAIIKIGFEEPNRLYLRECCYHTGGMDEYQIKEVLQANGWVNGQPFYSEHDVDAIGGLRKLGIYVHMARKGERCEWHAIKKIQRFSVYYTGADDDLHTERVKYKWVTVGDIITNTVEDTRKFHLMAALRYGVYTHFYHSLDK